MKRLPIHCLILMALAALVAAGCRPVQSPAVSESPPDLLNRTENPNFNDPYGGYNMMDTAPGFGDAAMMAEFDDDPSQEFDDPFQRASDVVEDEARDTNRLFLMITWGNIHRDSTIQHWTDWSGSLSVDPGVIVLKRTILFERNDTISQRVSRDLLEWQSTTRPHVDGILVKIFPRPQPSDANALADTPPDSAVIDSANTVIAFKTGPFSAEFTLDQLPGLNRVVTLDDGNAVAFNAVSINPHACPHGFLRGEWRNHPERPGGVFRGGWATADGEVRGFMRGIYGFNDAGEKVFFGKMISRDGRFEGIMRGRWDSHPAIDGGGWFAGHWVDRNLRIRGGLKGHWVRSNHCDGGFYRGVWRMDCANAISADF